MKKQIRTVLLVLKLLFVAVTFAVAVRFTTASISNEGSVLIATVLWIGCGVAFALAVRHRTSESPNPDPPLGPPQYPLTHDSHYEQIFAAHHHSSDYRVELVKGWCLIFAALALAFGWTRKEAPTLTICIPIVGIMATLFIWSADRRHRQAVNAAKEAGRSFEDSYMPESLRFFRRIPSGPAVESHSFLIDCFAGAIIGALIAATVFTARPPRPRNHTPALAVPPNATVIVEGSTDLSNWIVVGPALTNAATNTFFRLRAEELHGIRK